MKSYAWALIVLRNSGPPAQMALVEELLTISLGSEPDPSIQSAILNLFKQLAGELP